MFVLRYGTFCADVEGIELFVLMLKGMRPFVPMLKVRDLVR